MADSCKELPTFTACYVGCQLGVMRVGPVSAPSTFQRVMNVVTQSLPFVRAYIGDVLVFFKSMGKYARHVRELVSKSNHHGLKASLSKRHSAQSTIPLLGHVTTSGGARVGDGMIAAIKCSPTRTALAVLGSIFGLAGYFPRFKKRFFKISSVLDAAISRKASLDWTKDTEKAFCFLKMKSLPLLLFSASRTWSFRVVWKLMLLICLGAVSAQKRSAGKSHTLQLASRNMTGTERTSLCAKERLWP